jgi:hypothetical protein
MVAVLDFSGGGLGGRSPETAVKVDPRVLAFAGLDLN